VTTAPMWAGAAQKLGHALFFYTEMQRALEPDRSHEAAVMQSHFGTGRNWQQPFYANLDAFLAMARSVPAIIECCFGKDPQLKKWLRSPDARRAEKARQISGTVWTASRRLS
jgi:hypothetical protein